MGGLSIDCLNQVDILINKCSASILLAIMYIGGKMPPLQNCCNFKIKIYPIKKDIHQEYLITQLLRDFVKYIPIYL